MNGGKTLFAQLMEFVPWTSFSRIVRRHSGDARVRTLSCAEQFRAMAFAQLTWRESLRDVEITLAANAGKLYSMGFRSPVRRSTLADANESRDWRIWSDLAQVLIKRARRLYANDTHGVALDSTVYALDSSTVDLCLNLFEWAPFRTTKAAIKLHTLLDLRGAIPAFIHISDGKMSDVRVLDLLTLEPGAFYIMDRGYIDFARFYRMHQSGSFFVTRAKGDLLYRRVSSASVDRSAGLVSDQRIVLTGYRPARAYTEQMRRIQYNDPDTGKPLTFLTNNTLLPPLTICTLYKRRWQVELFFKWIKQHLRIAHFMGNSENAVKTQVWCAIATYLLIAIARKELRLEASMSSCLQILSASIFEKTELSCAFQPIADSSDTGDAANQLILFSF